MIQDKNEKRKSAGRLKNNNKNNNVNKNKKNNNKNNNLNKDNENSAASNKKYKGGESYRYMGTNFIDFITSSIKDIKKVEISLPIAMIPGTVTPLLVGDDLALRTSMTSPVGYDRELNKLLYKHVELYNPEDSNEKLKWTFEQFLSSISNIDRLFMFWGLYKATYNTLGKRKITCDNVECNTEFEEEVFLDDIIHDDTIIPWEENKPFYEFEYPITIVSGDLEFTFNTCIPTIRRTNNLFSLISSDQLQRNLQQINSLFSQAENLALITNSVVVKHLKNNTAAETRSLQEILAAFNSYIPKGVGEELIEKYGEKFDKYTPNFYMLVKCPSCLKEIRHPIELEFEFFRRGVFGKRAGI